MCVSSPQAITNLVTISPTEAAKNIVQLFNALFDVVGWYEVMYTPVALPGYTTSSTVTILSAGFRLLVSLLDKLQSKSLVESYKRSFFWRPGVYKVP